jgi:hypothetical protein
MTNHRVLIEVPAHRVAAVISFLDGRVPTAPRALKQSAPKPLLNNPDADAREKLWSDQDLISVFDLDSPSMGVMRRIFDVLAQAPGHWFSTTEIQQAIGRTKRLPLPQFGWDVRRWTERPKGEDHWPCDVRWGPDIDPSFPKMAHYQVSEKLANRWIQLRKKELS